MPGAGSTTTGLPSLTTCGTTDAWVACPTAMKNAITAVAGQYTCLRREADSQKILPWSTTLGTTFTSSLPPSLFATKRPSNHTTDHRIQFATDCPVPARQRRFAEPILSHATRNYHRKLRAATNVAYPCVSRSYAHRFLQVT